MKDVINKSKDNILKEKNSEEKQTNISKFKTCEFSKDSSYGYLIADTEYWEIFLAPSQRYLGTCVVSLKRDIGELKDLKTEEWIDFGNLVESMESANRKIFNADLFNWSCLKNSVFRKKNPEPHIHWHFIPRYESPIVFEGMEFDDPDFGYFARAIHKKIPVNVREKLLKLIKDNLILK